MAHWLFGEKSPNLNRFLLIFGWAVKIYKNEEKLNSSEKWQLKIGEIREKIKTNEKFKHPMEYNELIAFLFPELTDKLQEIKLKSSINI